MSQEGKKGSTLGQRSSSTASSRVTSGTCPAGSLPRDTLCGLGAFALPLFLGAPFEPLPFNSLPLKGLLIASWALPLIAMAEPSCCGCSAPAAGRASSRYQP